MSGDQVVEIFFNGQRELLNIIDTGGDIIRHLTRSNPICPLIGTKIRLEDQLGKGSYGTVFSIDFPGRGIKKYAAKRNDINVNERTFGPKDTFLISILALSWASCLSSVVNSLHKETKSLISTS